MLIDVLFPEDSGYNKSERKYFTSLKNIVIEPLNYFIKDIKIKNVTKITIQLYKNHQRDFFLEPNRMLSVVVIEKSFDFINKVVHTSNKKKSIEFQKKNQ